MRDSLQVNCACFVAFIYSFYLPAIPLNWFIFSTHATSCRIDLEVINLARNKLRDLPNLQEQVELEELDVSKNEIRVVGSNSLKELKNLKTLRLSENFIGKFEFAWELVLALSKLFDKWQT